jgi:hypothetical protein
MRVLNRIMLSGLLLAAALALVSVPPPPNAIVVRPLLAVAEAKFDPFAVPPPPPPELLSTMAGRRITIGGDIKQSKLIRQVRPVFPPEVKGRDFAGGLELDFTISTEGVPVNLKVVRTKMHPNVVRAIVESVSQWRYSPTLLHGKPVEVESQLDVRYCFD